MGMSPHREGNTLPFPTRAELQDNPPRTSQALGVLPTAHPPTTLRQAPGPLNGPCQLQAGGRQGGPWTLALPSVRLIYPITQLCIPTPGPPLGSGGPTRE